MFLEIAIHYPVQLRYLRGGKRVGNDEKSALLKFERERPVIGYLCYCARAVHVFTSKTLTQTPWILGRWRYL